MLKVLYESDDPQRHMAMLEEIIDCQIKDLKTFEDDVESWEQEIQKYERDR